MKYCVDFQKNLPCLSEADEINIKYNKKNTHVFDFLTHHNQQNINICLNSEEDFRLFLSNKEIDTLKDCKNFTIRLGSINEDTLAFTKILIERNIPFYFNVYVNNWELFLFLINKQVSSIYITGSLGFELDKITKITKEKKITIRAFPNVCQSEWIDAIPDIKQFFIRPEDIDTYEPFIDVIEFWGDLKNIATFYTVYKQDKKWFGKLNELIIDLHSDLDSRFILPRFAERRIRCNRECLKGGKCSLCDTIDQLSKTLEKNNILIKKER